MDTLNIAIGKIDGKGHEIRNIYIYSETDSVGFIYSCGGKLVRNLGISGEIIAKNGKGAGITVNTPDGTIIENCYNMCNIEATEKAGGITASTGKDVVIKNCFNMGNITAGMLAGGICGEGPVNNNTTIKNCYNTGNIMASGDGAGGIIGYHLNGNNYIYNCYNKGSVTGNYAGGIYGNLHGDNNIINCYNSGTINGTTSAGGIGGRTYRNYLYENVYNIGKITCMSDKGPCGLLGWVDNGVKVSGYEYYLDNVSVGALTVPYYSWLPQDTTTPSNNAFMQSQELLDKLNNRTKTKKGAAYWVKGANGYPELDYNNIEKSGFEIEGEGATKGIITQKNLISNIDTGIILEGDYKIEAEIKLLKTDRENVLYSDGSTKFQSLISTEKKLSVANNGTTISNNDNTIEPNTKYKIAIQVEDTSLTTTVNENNWIGGEVSKGSSSTLKLFTNASGENTCQMVIYSFKITKGTKVVLDLIPVSKGEKINGKTAEVNCFYDNVSGTFMY